MDQPSSEADLTVWVQYHLYRRPTTSGRAVYLPIVPVPQMHLYSFAVLPTQPNEHQRKCSTANSAPYRTYPHNYFLTGTRSWWIPRLEIVLECLKALAYLTNIPDSERPSPPPLLFRTFSNAMQLLKMQKRKSMLSKSFAEQFYNQTPSSGQYPFMGKPCHEIICVKMTLQDDNVQIWNVINWSRRVRDFLFFVEIAGSFFLHFYYHSYIQSCTFLFWSLFPHCIPRGHRHWCASQTVHTPPRPTNEIAPVNDNEMTPADEMV